MSGFTPIALTVATLVAVVGALVGIVLGRVERSRLELLTHIAVGTLFGITAFDILPEAKGVLSWPVFIGAGLFGAGLLWLVGHFVYNVCPSCAITHGEEKPHSREVSLSLLAIALGLHCVLDGLAISAGGDLSSRAAAGAISAVGLHKFPEGFALGLLLVGAHFSRGKALAAAVGIESLTVAGGLLGLLVVTKPTPAFLGGVFAFIGGGFVYLVANAFVGALFHQGRMTKRMWITAEATSFFVTGCVFWIASRA